MLAIARIASVRSRQLAAAVRGELEVGERLERAAQAVGVRAAGLGDALVGCHGLPLIAALICGGASPASRRCAIARTSRTRRASSPTSRPTDSPCALSVRNARVAARAVAGDERVDEAPDLALGGVRRRVLDDVAADRARRARARARASRARAAGAAGARRRARRAPARRRGRARRRACRPRPAASAAGPWPSAPARWRRRRRPSRRRSRARAQTLKRPSSRPKNAIVVSGAIAFSAGARCSLTSASFQRSTPSTTRKRRPIANVIASSARAIASGVAASPSNASTPPAAGLALGELAQRRAALADAAVVVAVDEVGGLEGGHGGRVYGGPQDRHAPVADAQPDGAVAVGAADDRHGSRERLERRRRRVAVEVVRARPR